MVCSKTQRGCSCPLAISRNCTKFRNDLSITRRNTQQTAWLSSPAAACSMISVQQRRDALRGNHRAKERREDESQAVCWRNLGGDAQVISLQGGTIDANLCQHRLDCTQMDVNFGIFYLPMVFDLSEEAY